MDIVACPYNRYFTELGCPELTRIFCANDNRCYGNLPGIEFKRSGAGWRYTWHLDEDNKYRFHFECNECLHHHIFGDRGLMKPGAMFCHSDVINFGNLPYTDFKRTKTLCQGGDCCDFDFVRYAADAGNGWERSDSI